VRVAGGRAGRPAGRADGEPRLVQARRQLAGEVTALHAAGHAPDTERARLLADLATRIDAALAWLNGDTPASEELAALARLAAKLRDCDTPGRLQHTELDTLWEETIRLLTAFGAPRPTGETPPTGTPRARFWKRPS